jgi:hypothetical protein
MHLDQEHMYAGYEFFLLFGFFIDIRAYSLCLLMHSRGRLLDDICFRGSVVPPWRLKSRQDDHEELEE